MNSLLANYLVTGGFGFVGSHLVEELINNNHKVTVLDNLSNGKLENVEHLSNFEKKITNVEKIKHDDFTENFDGIFHLATAPRSSSLSDPMTDIESNCKGMIAVLELAKKQNAKVVFTSNSGIYGSTNVVSPIDEKAENNPTTPYDANKLVSEYYAKIYHNIYGVKSTIVRFATVYGERQVVNEKLNWRPLVATFVKNLVNNEEVVINGDGEQTRDLIYVKDAVQGVIKAMNSSKNNAEIFLLSTNTETSVNDVLSITEDIVGLKASIRYTDLLKGDIKRMRYDYSKAKNNLGYEPNFSPKDGIKKLVRFTQLKKENSK
jgi:nucleoside-diphosphate-sugar epimerase